MMEDERTLAGFIKTFANMNLIVDWFPTILTSPNKLDEVQAGSRDEFYLLATYVFVLAIKMEYLCKVTQAYGLQGDPEIARQIKADFARIVESKAWRDRAYAAQEVMVRLYGEVGRTHQETLDQVANRKS